MTKRKRLIINVIMTIALTLLSVAGILVYFNYFPRVTVYFMDEYSIINAVELKKGNPLPNLPHPDKIGSSFEGWYSDDQLTDLYVNDKGIDHDLELFAKFEKIEYTLNFRIAGSEDNLYNTQHKFYKDAISLPTGDEYIEYKGNIITLATYKPGYDFVGWTLTEDGTGDIYNYRTGFSMVPYNAVLYAKWTPKTWVYSFNNVFYTSPERVEIYKHELYGDYVFTYTQQPQAPEDPYEPFYTFDGWYTDLSFTQQVDFERVVVATNGALLLDGQVICSSFNLYAKFDINEHTLSFDTNAPAGAYMERTADELPQDINVYYGYQVVNLPTTCGYKAMFATDRTQEMYKFVGWTREKSQDAELVTAFEFEEDEDVVLYAKWQRYYYLYFNYNGQRLSYYTTKATIGDTVTLKPALKKSNADDAEDITVKGYHFIGWKVTKGDTSFTDVTFTYTLTKESNIEFDAQMAKNVYYITIDIAPDYISDEAVFPDPDDLKAEYSSSFTEASATNPNGIPSYTKTAVKPKYRQRGWEVVSKSGTMFNYILGVTEAGVGKPFELRGSNIDYAEFVNGRWEITITPHFEKEVTLSYNLNGAPGDDPESETKLLGEVFVIKSPNVTYKYFTFAGWSTDPNAETATYTVNSRASFDTDTTLFAVWTPVKYTLKIINKGVTGNNNNESKSYTFNKNEPVQLDVNEENLNITIPTGYHFEGLTRVLADVNIQAEFVVSDVPHEITVEMAPEGKTTLNLYTVIKVNTYTLTWMVGDEVYDELADVQHGASITHPTDPVKQGATFIAWITGEDERVISNGYSVSSDMVLVAKFEKNTYSVNFMYADPYKNILNGTKTIEYDYGDEITQAQINEINSDRSDYEGYDFAGWYTSLNPTSSDQPLVAGREITSRVIFYTIYTAKTLTITYRPNGGVGENIELETKYDQNITLPTATSTGYTRDGMTLTGWITQSGIALGSVGESIKIKYFGTLNVDAVWKQNYVLSYYIPDGATSSNLPQPTTYLDGDQITIPNNIVVNWTGKTFSNVWSDGVNTYTAGSTLTIDRDIELTAVFSDRTLVATYKLYYVRPNGNIVSYTFGTQEYNYAASVNFYVLTAEDLTRIPAGTTHDGWCLNQNGGNKLSDYSILDNTTFYLRILTTYVLEYNLNAADATNKPDNGRFVPGKEYTLSSVVPQRQAYEFIGWCKERVATEESDVYPSGSDVVFTEESKVTLYAIYEEADLVLTFASTESSQSATMGVKLNKVITLPSAVTVAEQPFEYAGFRLTAWKDSSNNIIGAVGDETTIAFTTNTTWYAVWTKEYSVFFVDGEDATQSIEYDEHIIIGQTITIIENTFAHVGKSFSNWTCAGSTYTDNELVQITNGMLSDNKVTFTAQFVDIYYTLSFVKKQDDTHDTTVTQSVIHGGSYAAPSASDTNSYRFIGWSTTEGGVASLSVGDSITNVTADATYYAVYIRTYTVSYTDGTTTNNVKYDTGTVLGNGYESFAVYPAFEKSGYTFVGYSDGTNNYEIDNTYIYTTVHSYLKSLTVGADTTLTALYAQHLTLTLAYYSNTHVVSTALLEGDTVNLGDYSTTFTRSGYSINGYTLNTTDDLTINDPVTLVNAHYVMPATSTTLHPVWGPQLRDVVFVLNDGTANTVVVPTAVGSTVASFTPTRAGYEFDDWYVDSTTVYDFTTPITADGLTITAHWNKLYYVSFMLDLESGETYTGSLPTVDPDGYKYNELIDLTTNIERAGYTFANWNFYYGSTLVKVVDANSHTINGTDLIVDDGDAEHSLVFQANWNTKTFVLTISGIDNAVIKKNNIYEYRAGDTDNITVYYNSIITINDNQLVVTNYLGTTYTYVVVPKGRLNVGGWTNNGTDMLGTFTMPAGIYTVYPVLTNGTLTITYNLNTANSGKFSYGGTLYTSLTQSVSTFATSDAVTFVPETGYELVNWYYKPATSARKGPFTTSEIVLTNQIEDCTVTVYTQLKKVNVTVNFYTSTGFAFTTETYSYGTSDHSMIEGMADGSTFSIDFGSTVYFRATTSQKLTPYTYTLSTSAEVYPYNLTNSFKITQENAYTVTITYDVRRATITYYDLEASAEALGTQNNVDYGHCINDLDVPEFKYNANNMNDIIVDSPYNGRRFVSWYQDEELTIPFLMSTIINDDINVYAKRENLHRLTFVVPSGISTTGAVPEVQYATLSGSYNYANTHSLARTGYTLIGWTLTAGATSVNVGLSDNSTVQTLFGSLASPTSITATPRWQREVYRVYFTTNSTPSETKGYVKDRDNIPSVSLYADLTYEDTLRITDISEGTIAKRLISAYHDGASSSFVSIQGIAQDESWTYNTTNLYLGEGITADTYASGSLVGSLTTEFTIDDYTGQTLVVVFMLKGNHLQQHIDVVSDYALGNNGVKVDVTIVNGDGADPEKTAYTNLTGATTNRQLANGDNFDLFVPRNNNRAYIVLTVTALEGFQLYHEGLYKQSYEISYKNIVNHGSHTIKAYLKSYSITVGTDRTGWGTQTWGTVGYSYKEYAKNSDGFIVDTSYTTISDTNIATSQTLTITHFTPVSITATANGGREFAYWNTSTITSNNYTFNVNGAITYNAFFTQNEYTYTFKINGVEWATVEHLHVDDDITSLVEAVAIPTPAQLDQASWNATRQWFNRWDLTYTSGRVICTWDGTNGTANKTINALLDDAYIVTVQVNAEGLTGADSINAGYISYDTPSANVYRRAQSTSDNKVYTVVFKVHANANVPTVNVYRSGDGFVYAGTKITYASGSSTTYYTTAFDISNVSQDTTATVNFNKKLFTLNFKYSDDTIWNTYSNVDYTNTILSFVGENYPEHKDTSPEYAYRFDYWTVSVVGTPTRVTDVDTIISMLGDLANGSAVSVMPSYTQTQKYSITIMNGESQVFNDYLFVGDTITFGKQSDKIVATINGTVYFIYPVSGKEYVYLSTSSSDNGNATTTSSIYMVEYLYHTASGTTPAYREKVNSLNNSLTIDSSNVTLYATYVNKYTITMQYDTSASDYSDTVVADTGVGLSLFNIQANTELSPHYQVLLFTKSTAWSVRNGGNAVDGASDYLVGKDTTLYVNPDATVVVNDNITFTYVRKQLSKYARVHVDETTYNSYASGTGAPSRAELVASGTYLVNAMADATSHVIPYIPNMGTWMAGGDFVQTAPWAAYLVGYTFVGYKVYVGGSLSGLYTVDGAESTQNISNLVMNSSQDIDLVCIYKINNVQLTITGDLPYYGSSYSTITVNYYTETSSTRYATQILTNSTVIIRQKLSNYEISTNSGSSWTAVSGTTYTISLAYSRDIVISISSAVNSLYNTCSFNAENFATGYRPTTETVSSMTIRQTANVASIEFTYVNTLQLIRLGEERDGYFGSDQNQIITTWKRQGESTAVTELSYVYGTKVKLGEYRLEVQLYNWKTESYASATYVNTSLTNTENYRHISYKLNGTEYAFNAHTETLTGSSIYSLKAMVSRIYYIIFNPGYPTPFRTDVNYMPTNLTTVSTAVTKSEIIYMYGLSGSSRLAPTLNGYTFKGWYSSDLDRTVNESTSTITLGSNYANLATITFTARWNANPVTVTLQYKILHPDNDTDVTSQFSDVAWSSANTTVCYDDVITLTGTTSVTFSAKEPTAITNGFTKNVLAPSSHYFTANLKWNNSTTLTPKYEYVSYTYSAGEIVTIDGKTSQVITGNATILVTLRIKKYTVSVVNVPGIACVGDTTTRSVSVPYGTSITFPTLQTPANYISYYAESPNDVLISINDSRIVWHDGYDRINLSSITMTYTEVPGYTLPTFDNVYLYSRPSKVSVDRNSYIGVSNSSSGGSLVKTTTVTGVAKYYVRWLTTSWTATARNAWIQNDTMIDPSNINGGCAVNVDGIDLSRMMFVKYNFPSFMSTSTTTFTFPTTHPWIKNTSGDYFYIPGLTSKYQEGTSSGTTYNITSVDANGVLTDSGVSTFAFTFGKATNFIIYTAEPIRFVPGASVILDSNDGTTTDKRTYTSVGSSVAEINGNFSGVAEGEDLIAKCAGGTQYGLSDKYYNVDGFSTVANTITNYNQLSNGKLLTSTDYLDKFKSSTITTLYAAWKTKNDYEQYITLSGSLITKFDYLISDNEKLAIPQFKTFTNGSLKITGVNISEAAMLSVYSQTAMTNKYGSENNKIVYNNPNYCYTVLPGWITSISGMGIYGISPLVDEIVVSATSQFKSDEIVNFNRKYIEYARFLFSPDYSKLIFVGSRLNREISLVLFDNSDGIRYRMHSGATYVTQISQSFDITKLTTIGSYAFYNSRVSQINLAYVANKVNDPGTTSTGTKYLASSVTTLENHAFYTAQPRITMVNAPAVTSIGVRAFAVGGNHQENDSLIGVYGITSWHATYYDLYRYNSDFPSIAEDTAYCSLAIDYIGEDAFYQCWNLTSVGRANYVDISGGDLYAISDYAFYHCESITAVIVPNTVESVGEYAFAGTSLTRFSTSSWDDTGTSTYNCYCSFYFIGEHAFNRLQGTDTLTFAYLNFHSYDNYNEEWRDTILIGECAFLGSTINNWMSFQCPDGEIYIYPYAFGYITIRGSISFNCYDANLYDNAFCGDIRITNLTLNTESFYCDDNAFVVDSSKGYNYSINIVKIHLAPHFNGTYKIPNIDKVDHIKLIGNEWGSNTHDQSQIGINIGHDNTPDSDYYGYSDGYDWDITIYDGVHTGTQVMNKVGYVNYEDDSGSHFYSWIYHGIWEYNYERFKETANNDTRCRCYGEIYEIALTCFADDTWVDVWDEKRKKRIRKRAKDIKYSDKLIVWNFVKGCFDVAKPLFIQKSMQEQKFTRVHFADGSYFDVVKEHAMFNADTRSFRPVLNDTLMPIGTHVFKDDGTLTTIVAKEVIKKNVEYTNIITYDHMNIFTNGVLTSTPLNNRYYIPEGSMKWQIDDEHCEDTTLLDGVPKRWIKGLHLDTKPDRVLRNMIARTPGAHNMLDWLTINKFNVMKDK